MKLCAIAPDTPRMTSLRVFNFWTSSRDRKLGAYFEAFEAAQQQIAR